MWDRSLLKENGKVAFQRNYWLCVLVSLILMVVTGGQGSGFSLNLDLDMDSDMMYYSGIGGSVYADVMEEVKYVLMFLPLILIACVIGFVIGIAIVAFVSNILEVGGTRYFMENREHKTGVVQVLYGFNSGNYMNCVKVMFCRTLYIFGWSLLLVIPGIIKSYSYRMLPYILAENPDISKDRAFDISMQMMDGHKMDAFVLELSFIGWDILSGITGGLVGIFYVNPYKHATYAEFYAAVKAEAFAKGITDVTELPGVSIPEFTDQFQA